LFSWFLKLAFVFDDPLLRSLKKAHTFLKPGKPSDPMGITGDFQIEGFKRLRFVHLYGP
jgi:hypothetical protein